MNLNHFLISLTFIISDINRKGLFEVPHSTSELLFASYITAKTIEVIYEVIDFNPQKEHIVYAKKFVAHVKNLCNVKLAVSVDQPLTRGLLQQH